MSVVTENSFLCDNTILQTTTKAQVGRRVSGFVQVGQGDGDRFRGRFHVNAMVAREAGGAIFHLVSSSPYTEEGIGAGFALVFGADLPLRIHGRVN